MFNGQGKRFRDENLFFNGLYQVNKIESSFNQGQFTQTLHCSRFNNQQGQGLAPVLANASTSSLTEIKQKIDKIKRLEEGRKDVFSIDIDNAAG